MDRVSLYLVATPIGNMGDMSARGAEVLSDVDFICAEDTRKSGILLKKFGIDKPMISYHEHNAVSRSAQIADRLEQGQCCALIGSGRIAGEDVP